jgi:hypothetical protein
MATPAAVLVCVLNLLSGSTARLPPIELVDTLPSNVSRNAEAFVRYEPARIYLVTSTPVFREAQRTGSPNRSRDPFIKLASIIVHEAWHLNHGEDEESAYDAQLIALLSMGVPSDSSLFHSVMKSKLTVTQARRRTPRGAILIVASKQ